MGNDPEGDGKDAVAAPTDAALMTDAEAEAIAGGGLLDIFEVSKIVFRGSLRGDISTPEKARDFLKERWSAVPTSETGQ
ncbi:hypothetical protein [Aquabacter sediminis]|uniref:hypothetical protein n=1 Tax=Aquabacter sediminis TaxID=3029197 RepID=UPI00237EC887|nr:hypothetical protein [Aquabacter sp. P-9]MDE1569459.1 hypothetical protein [Aquabacter sp. P-9]